MQKETPASQKCEGLEDRVETYWSAAWLWNMHGPELSNTEIVRLQYALRKIISDSTDPEDKIIQRIKQLLEKVKVPGIETKPTLALPKLSE